MERWRLWGGPGFRYCRGTADAPRWWSTPRVIVVVVVVAALAVGAAVVVTWPALRPDPKEPADVFTYETDGSTSSLVLHFQYTQTNLGCLNEPASARVVREDADQVEVEVEVLLDVPFYEKDICDYFDGPPVDTIGVVLDEPLGDRSVVAFGDTIHSIGNPRTVVPRMVTVIEFVPSGLTGMADGPSLFSEYTEWQWNWLEVLPTDYVGPSSWFDLLPEEGCEAKPMLVVVNDEQFADALADPDLA